MITENFKIICNHVALKNLKWNRSLYNCHIFTNEEKYTQYFFYTIHIFFFQQIIKKIFKDEMLKLTIIVINLQRWNYNKWISRENTHKKNNITKKKENVLLWFYHELILPFIWEFCLIKTFVASLAACWRLFSTNNWYTGFINCKN